MIQLNQSKCAGHLHLMPEQIACTTVSTGCGSELSNIQKKFDKRTKNMI